MNSSGIGRIEAGGLQDIFILTRKLNYPEIINTSNT